MLRELILVADDELVTRALVRSLSVRYRVSWTSNAVAARDVVKSHRFDALVCAAGFRSDALVLLHTFCASQPGCVARGVRAGLRRNAVHPQ